MAIDLQLTKPIGPNKVERLTVRTELHAVDAVRMLRCLNDGDSSEIFHFAALAIDLGAALTERPITELRELAGQDAEVLREICAMLAISTLTQSYRIEVEASGEVCGLQVRAPTLGELAQSERAGGEFEIIAACAGLSTAELEKRSAAEFLAIRRGMLTLKKSMAGTRHPALQALDKLLLPEPQVAA